MTPTIETGAALTAFQPGDRVLVEAVVKSVDAADHTISVRGLFGIAVWFSAENVHPLPTAPAQLRAVEAWLDKADFATCGVSNQDRCRASQILNSIARHLESTSAPKPPPTLRDLAEKAAAQFEFYEQQHRAKGTPDADAKAEVNRALAVEMREALAREGAAP